MRNTAIFAVVAAGLALAACSEQTQKNAEGTVEAAGNDIQGALARATEAADHSARAIGEAADRGTAVLGSAADKAVQGAAGAAGEFGRKVQEEAAKVEARTQNEPASDARAD